MRVPFGDDVFAVAVRHGEKPLRQLRKPLHVAVGQSLKRRFENVVGKRHYLGVVIQLPHFVVAYGDTHFLRASAVDEVTEQIVCARIEPYIDVSVLFKGRNVPQYLLCGLAEGDCELAFHIREALERNAVRRVCAGFAAEVDEQDDVSAAAVVGYAPRQMKPAAAETPVGPLCVSVNVDRGAAFTLCIVERLVACVAFPGKRRDGRVYFFKQLFNSSANRWLMGERFPV